MMESAQSNYTLKPVTKVGTRKKASIQRNISIVQGLIRALISEEFLFRVHKNMFDNVVILARKPS